MTVPPFIEVSHLAPGFWRWLINLAWVRYITRRPAPKAPSPEEMGTPDAEFLDEKKETIDDQSSFMDELPLLGKTQKPDDPDGTTEHGQSKLSPVFFHHMPIHGFCLTICYHPPPFLSFAGRNIISHRLR
jgi:hypothetical protein